MNGRIHGLIGGVINGKVDTLGSLLKQINRNQDIVEVSGYVDINTAVSNVSNGAAGRSFFTTNNNQKIRQSGFINKIRLRIYSKGTSIFWFQVWRKNEGATFDLVSEENITDALTEIATNDVVLSTPIAAIEGDYCSLSSIGGGVETFTVTAGYSGVCHYYDNAARPSGNAFNWVAHPSLNGYVLPIKTFMQAPLLIAIGDSIIAGHPAHYSYIEDATTDVSANSITGRLAAIDHKYICQNMGIGSQTSTQIAARFSADVVALKPKIVVINGGVNDITAGSISKATFLANYTAMLNACVAASIVPVILKLIPWTNGTNEQMQTRDEWMTDLAALVATYDGAIFVDFDSAIGKFRNGGDAGNLWDLQTTPDYDADGVHPTLIGYAKMAEVIDIEIKKRYRF